MDLIPGKIINRRPYCHVNGSEQNGVLLYPVNFVQAGLPIGTEWNITLEGKTHSTYNITYSTYLPNGNYSYNISKESVLEIPASDLNKMSTWIPDDFMENSPDG